MRHYLGYLWIPVVASALIGCGGGDDATTPAQQSNSGQAPSQAASSEASQGWSQDSTATQLTTVEVFKYVGSKQCQGGGTNLDAMADQLMNAGIVPISLACGSDGLTRSSQCGSDDGNINIFEISTTNLNGALFMGYRRLSDLGEPSKAACDF